MQFRAVPVDSKRWLVVPCGARHPWGRSVRENPLEMWCKDCRQDVPGISLAASGGLSCARCGAILAHGDEAGHVLGVADTAAHGVDLTTSQPLIGRHASFEEWQFDQNYRELQARVGNWHRLDRPVPRPRDDAPQNHTQWHVHGAHAGPPEPHRARSRRAGRWSSAAWVALSLGLMAVLWGGGLLAWSSFAHRPELWTLGMPLALAGQVGLLLGLVLQLDRLWHSSREAVRKLEDVDVQLHQLERTTTMLSVTHSSAAQAFYAHMTEQANPEILLADLKGQVDLLARSIARRAI